MVAYVGYVTPPIFLLTLLAFYDPKTSLCYEFESIFLLDNTQSPSLQSLPGKETVAEEFLAFQTKFFSPNHFYDNYDDNFDDNYDDNSDDTLSSFESYDYLPQYYGNYYFYYNENYNYNYLLPDTDDQVSESWENHLGNLSIPNKYYLLKSLGIKDRLHNWNEDRNYYHQIFASFNSADVIDNLLSLLREFGFLHICSEMKKFESYRESKGNSLSVVDTLGHKNSWWRGYSPYDVDYSDNFEILLDALLLFQEDIRFSQHLVCFAKIFDIDQNVLYRDFSHLKDLKATKTAPIVRRGDYLNGTFSMYFHRDFNPSNPRAAHIVIKLFTGVIESLGPELKENLTCANQLRKDDFFEEFTDEQRAIELKILSEQVGINSTDG